MSAPRSLSDAIEEQAAARAIAYLAIYLDEGKRRGERQYLERARKALDEALCIDPLTGGLSLGTPLTEAPRYRPADSGSGD